MMAKFAVNDTVQYPADGVTCTGIVTKCVEFDGAWYYHTKESDGTECSGIPEYFISVQIS